MIKIKELLINGIDYSDYATIPLQTQDTLDESLDMAYLELKGLENESPFVPFSDVYLKITDKDNNIKEMYMFIESDEVTHIIGINRYNHNILLIEETKWLERFFIEKSVTKPLEHNYTEGATKVIPKEILGKAPPPYPTLVSPMKNGIEFTFPSVFDIYKTTIVEGFELSSAGSITIRENDKQIYYGLDIKERKTIKLADNARYEVEYYVISVVGGMTISWSCSYSFVTIDETIKYKRKTIKDVINILLETAETLRESEKPRFRLAETIEYVEKSEEYKKRINKILNIETPEFYFSKMSLFEALKMVGNYAHFIPRMKQKAIYLDLLGMEDKVSGIQFEDYYSYTANQNINDFCTKLDSQVNNFVNLDNDAQGSVITPFNDGYRTLRAETGTIVINDQNIIIPTESPIEKIIKLEIGYLKGLDEPVGDITPYVYESAEYDGLLSSYSDEYPYAKMYALKYTQGSPNITGLSFERQNVISQAFEGIALKNIIFRKINREVSWFNNLWDSDDTFQIQYRLTYIPNTSSRVTQSKAYKDNITKSISIAYNQSASKISSNAYGENLKGQILKMGNIEKHKMYILPNLDYVPQCGQKFDNDYYISTVKCEYYPNFIKCEVGLSKDYNNKSAYVEVDSQLRFYEISEKIAYDVYRIYEDYCEIGFDSKTDNLSLITDDGINKFAKAFNYGYNDVNLSMVKASSMDEEKRILYDSEYVLPVISLAVGNSLLFEFHYTDNYSAGSTVKYETIYDDYENITKTRVQELEAYTDNFGEIAKLGLKYGKNLTLPKDYNEAVRMGDNIPLEDVVTLMEIYFDTENNPIILKKDNREAIHFTYQIHFVANNNNLIIGSGLARYSTFVTSETMNYKLVLLKERLSKFESEIDLTNTYFYDSIKTIEDYENKKIKLSNVIAPENEEWKSWAIVQTILNDKNEIVKAILILGENKDIKSGDIIEMPNFVFKHKIVEE